MKTGRRSESSHSAADRSPQSPCSRGVRTCARTNTCSRSARTDRACLRSVPEALCLGQGLELLQRVVLDLADALARHVEGLADLLEGAGALARQAEAHLDHLALARRQRRQGAPDVLAAA